MRVGGERGVDVPVGSTKPTPPGTAVFPDWQQLVGTNRAKELETPKQVMMKVVPGKLTLNSKDSITL